MTVSTKTPSDHIVQVIAHHLLVSAIQLLQSGGTFACCVSALSRTSLIINLVHREFLPVDHIGAMLRWTLFLYKYASNIWSRTHAVRKHSLQLAGLQVRATTLS